MTFQRSLGRISKVCTSRPNCNCGNVAPVVIFKIFGFTHDSGIYLVLESTHKDGIKAADHIFIPFTHK